MTFHSIRSFITSEVFFVRVADWTNDISSQGNFVVRVPDWLHLESVRILFTMIFVDKSQYL